MHKMKPAGSGTGIKGETALDQSLNKVLAFDQRQRQAARLIILNCGVWMPPDVYTNWPVLLPWIIRDNTLSKAENKHLLETAHPEKGWRRSDNAPIGNLKRSLKVNWRGKPAWFGSKGLDKGWWAAHLAGSAKDPLTNSFVGNLVWLPAAIAKLTDKGELDTPSLFQQEARAISWALYRHAPIVEPLEGIVDGIWRSFGEPLNPDLTEEEHGLVNWFTATPDFHHKVRGWHTSVWDAVNTLVDNPGTVRIQVSPPKYKASLPEVTDEGKVHLRQHLEPFARAALEARISENTPSPAMVKSPTKAKSSIGDSSPLSFCLTTPHGTTRPTKRTQLAIGVVAAVIGQGVAPNDVRATIGAANLAYVAGRLSGDELWSAMAAAQVTGTRGHWFVEQPIVTRAGTWVLKKNVWTKAKELHLARLCEMTGGAVNFTTG